MSGIASVVDEPIRGRVYLVRARARVRVRVRVRVRARVRVRVRVRAPAQRALLLLLVEHLGHDLGGARAPASDRGHLQRHAHPRPIPLPQARGGTHATARRGHVGIGISPARGQRGANLNPSPNANPNLTPTPTPTPNLTPTPNHRLLEERRESSARPSSASYGGEYGADALRRLRSTEVRSPSEWVLRRQGEGRRVAG
jgi:hypothetical protein